jgi:hypothetical protein|tara:strand:+ start:25320 stop:25883 length:564 start_codon:yes stop_codon:yes gene_type:complete
MRNTTKTLLVIAMVINITACKSKQEVIKTNDQEIEVIIPCSGEKYRSDSKYIRASSMGESQDMTLAKKKARNNTLQELASKVQTTVQSVVDNYQNSTETQNGENISKRFEALTREVVDVEISNYITACEKLTKTKKGTFRSYLSYEIEIESLLEPLSAKISQDEVLRIDYNYEKFKKNFHDALSKNK